MAFSLNVDVQDKVLRELMARLEEATVLCIAHRSDTVLEFDSVNVLDQRRVIETGHLRDLLRSRESAFSALYE